MMNGIEKTAPEIRNEPGAAVKNGTRRARPAGMTDFILSQIPAETIVPEGRKGIFGDPGGEGLRDLFGEIERP